MTIKIDLGTVQETLILPLWARARETEKDNPVVCDPCAKNIVERIDYDFSQIEGRDGSGSSRCVGDPCLQLRQHR